MEIALYFPYIRVPQTPWFSQVLLYWDEAATIVPRSMIDQLGEYSPYMNELADAGLLRTLTPDDEVWRLKEDQFNRGFLSVLEAHKKRLPERIDKWSRIHIAKMAHPLFSELGKLGLAWSEGGKEWEHWYKVESSTADLYMAYLAGAMSGRIPGSLPVTDRRSSIGALGGSAGSLEKRLAALRYTAVTEALPAPCGPVPALELKRFKEQNRDQLMRCRRHLDEKLAEIASIDDPNLREFRSQLVMEAIRDDVAVLQEQMLKRNWPKVALLGFGAVVGAALTTAAVIATGGTALAVGLGVGSGALQIGAAGYTAVELVQQLNQNPTAPLAYAALASRLH